MSLVVFGAPLSPFVRKVRLFAAEKGFDYQLENVNPFNQPDWYRELNPLRRVPAIRDGDFTLADSSVICHYLEDRDPQRAPLCGKGAQARARINWLEKYADYELAPLTTFTVFRNRLLKPLMGKVCDEMAVKGAMQEKLPEHFDYLEKCLGEQQWFVDDHFSLADIAIACQLVNLRHGEEQLDAQRWPRLAAHFERTLARPALAEIVQGELQIIAKIMAKR
ncbi:glutathione S-transferase family protein [Pseudomonas sp. GD04087]|uniref:glutathione S-transferase family protein n=1 Tax=unclassified Pseudomonas TaxID=196821 RepID=UPI002447C464|nr:MULTISPECIES: glutathione S-transferase family protein [unclassified Pseudomonas]MDH0292457.1 glutathione S-transferase family protein [Pseudomonas sp. GD04087]MDH1050569.1 glutathione S-transferase family protein [Pseudomonas sp. GD03903]MDH2002712.1 glutathione S-transferase family protein [Pseudomonas sp. GD03691]